MAKSKDVTKRRLTAIQFESCQNLPLRLQEIGKQIEAKLAKAALYQGKAVDMVDSIDRLLDEAKDFCDDSGFKLSKMSEPRLVRACKGTGQIKPGHAIPLQ